MTRTDLPEFLQSGERARLIPTLPDSKREQKVTSSVLASFRAVPQFGLDLLSEVGAPSGKRSRVDCYTEVVFRNCSDKRSRPDGLIIVSTGRREWTALIEAKAGNAAITQDQIEEYISIAKTNNIDAVITISNQYASLPSHHPLQIPKAKLRNVGLFHFSWMAICSKAILLRDSKRIDDPEQAFILEELIRYLDHEASGVVPFSRMPKEWREAATAIQQGAVLRKNDSTLRNAVVGWHALSKFLCLELSVATGASVGIKLPRRLEQNSEDRIQTDTASLAERNTLEVAFSVPNTAGPLNVTADFLRRVITLSIRIAAPKDKARNTAAVNWLIRQIPQSDEDETTILRAHWPGRIMPTDANLSVVREDISAIIQENKGAMPTGFEILRVQDLAGRFVQAQNFVEEIKVLLPDFYYDLVQHLRAWTPSAPKIKSLDKGDDEPDDSDNVLANETVPNVMETTASSHASKEKPEPTTVAEQPENNWPSWRNDD